MSYGPYDQFLEVRPDGTIIGRPDDPRPCARCGKCHFSFTKARKCADILTGRYD